MASTPWQRAILGLVVVALVAACSAPGPSPSPTPSTTPAPSSSATASAGASLGPSASVDNDTIYRQIAAQIVAIRGLDAPSRVEPVVIDRATLQKNLQVAFDKENPPAQIARTERIEKALGLLPSGLSLRDLYVELQGSQVIGYYDQDAKQLFIVSHDGGLGPTERLTYAHEFTHELQDLRCDLKGLGLDKMTDDSDRGLAILSLVEGDAVSTQTAWMAANLSAVELAQVAVDASDPAALAIFAGMPAILRETSLFPYQNGAAFVAALQARGGEAAVNAAFKALPASTEQILHPEKYAAGEMPVPVNLPSDLAARFGTGWSVAATDTLGELQLRVWLRAAGLAGDVARTASDGWGGDRLALLGAPGGAGDLVVLVTEWDTTADALAFLAAARTVVVAGGGGGSGVAVGGSVAASGRRVVVAIGTAVQSVAGLDSILEALTAG